MREMIHDIKEAEKSKPGFWMTNIGSHFKNSYSANAMVTPGYRKGYALTV